MACFRKYVESGGVNPLFKRDGLYNAALDSFSKTPFNDVSINAILRDAKMNKGSFYLKFYDKLDLYLCMMERVGKDKMEFLSKKLLAQKPTYHFFNQLHTIVLSSMEYARHDARFYAFWRIYLAEEDGIKNKVKKEFPELTNDFLGEMIDAAIEAGQINPKYDQAFVHLVIELYFNNLDKLVNASMTDDEIRARVEQVISFFKDSLAVSQ